MMQLVDLVFRSFRNTSEQYSMYPNKVGLNTKEWVRWSSHHSAAETNLTRNQEAVGSIPGLAQWVKDPAFL